GPIPPADQAFDSITLSPKLIAGQTIVSNQLIRQSSPDIEAFIVRDSDAISVQVDQAALFGAGSATVPKGIMSYTANAPCSFAYNLRPPSITWGGPATWANILQMGKNLEDGRIFNDGSFAYVTLLRRARSGKPRRRPRTIPSICGNNAMTRSTA